MLLADEEGVVSSSKSTPLEACCSLCAREHPPFPPSPPVSPPTPFSPSPPPPGVPPPSPSPPWFEGVNPFPPSPPPLTDTISGDVYAQLRTDQFHCCDRNANADYVSQWQAGFVEWYSGHALSQPNAAYWMDTHGFQMACCEETGRRLSGDTRFSTTTLATIFASRPELVHFDDPVSFRCLGEATPGCDPDNPLGTLVVANGNVDFASNYMPSTGGATVPRADVSPRRRRRRQPRRRPRAAAAAVAAARAAAVAAAEAGERQVCGRLQPTGCGTLFTATEHGFHAHYFCTSCTYQEAQQNCDAYGLRRCLFKNPDRVQPCLCRLLQMRGNFNFAPDTTQRKVFSERPPRLHLLPGALKTTTTTRIARSRMASQPRRTSTPRTRSQHAWASTTSTATVAPGGGAGR